MTQFEELINKLKDYEYSFVTEIFNGEIKKVVNHLFPNLNKNDLLILQIFTIYLIEDISIRYNFQKKTKYYLQWKKNNNQDILAVILMLLPFINDKNNDKKWYHNMRDLNQILHNHLGNDISNSILSKPIAEALKMDMSFSNFSIGLLNNTKKNTVLELIDNEGTKLIYHIIHHNFCSILETLKITYGKLYVNWMNIVPIVEYKKSNIYKKSSIELSKLKENLLNNDIDINLKTNKGLWFGDYYNVYHNGYYKAIKKIKWTIYNKRMKDAKQGIYMIQYLDKMLDLTNMFILDNYDNLTKSQQVEFNERLRKITFNLKNKNPLSLDSAFEIDIFKNIILFLVNNSTERFLLSGSIFNKFKLSETEDSEDLDEIEEILIDKTNEKYISDEILIEALEEIAHNNQENIVWNYLKQTINELKPTQYGRFLIKNNKINHDFFYFPMQADEDYKINLKNIYNIAKTLVHNENWTLLGSNFKNLSKESKYIFFMKYLNIIPFNNWLNIRNNIIIQEGDNVINMNNIITNIKNGWNKIKKFLVWDYLTYNGMLNEFKVNLALTDDKQLPVSTNVKKTVIQKRLSELFDKNKHYQKAHYFLTNEPYNKLLKFEEQGKEKTYFEALTSELLFYSYYAMDWMSQINFFNHYINHQIIYVTGSTGTGKSTQVPKLLLYALKMYDYNPAGKVICTQPRIPPTVGNATWISKEMGVQNIRKSIKKNDIKTNQYYLQYKHQMDRHTKENCNFPTIRMVTDGTLLEELINNPLMKVQIKKKSKEKKSPDQIDFIYSLENKFDVIIVDEAHEHNTNMDIILTLARQSCMYNNSMRLVIVSATMDDDEPIYRSYFSIINDNLVYPIKQPLILHPILDIENFLIESIYLDRRIHISPPGQTTQYRIDEYYNEEIEQRIQQLDYKKRSQIAQEESYKTIIDICNNSTTGEILLFLTGKREIKEALNYLNKNLPSYVVALPFFSGINEKYRDIISKININKKLIRNFRENIENEWDEEYIDSKDVTEGTYKRVVIIATNVAEASITVPGLKYVVDTGYAKVSSFDKIYNISNLNVEEISEASRIQRKGRVGRVANGEVYYIYGKGRREKNKPKYGITQDNFSNNYLKLARKYGNDENELLWIDSFNPYLYNIFLQMWYDEDIHYSARQKIYLYKKNIDNIIQRQFLIEDEILLDMFFKSPYFDVFGIDFTDQEKLNVSGFPYIRRYATGYNFTQLNDLTGKFYIIHPFENTIERNLNNEIISHTTINNVKKMTNSINKINWYPTWYQLKNSLLYVDINPVQINSNILEGTYIKTLYTDKINETIKLMQSFRLDTQEAIVLLFGTGYNIQLEVCEILAMLRTIDGNISSLASKNIRNPKILDFDKFFEKHKSNSDLVSIHNICKLLRTTFNNMLIYQIYNKINVTNKYKRIYESLVTEYKKLKFTVNPPSELEDSWNILNWLKENGKLNSDTGFLYWLSSSEKIKNDIMNDIKNYYSNIELLCKNEYLNFNKVLLYYENFINLIIGVKTAEKDLEKEYGEMSSLEWILELQKSLLKPLFNPTIENKILISFLFSSPINIAIRMDTFSENYNIITNGKDVTLPPLFNNINTLCESIGNYLYYYTIKESNDGIKKINILNNIDIKLLSNVYPLHYNKKFIKTEYIKDNMDGPAEIVRFYGSNWEHFIHMISNNFSLNYFPLSNSIELPVINIYMKNIKIDLSK